LDFGFWNTRVEDGGWKIEDGGWRSGLSDLGFAIWDFGTPWWKRWRMED
jgi:hypothetical protein